MGKKHRFNGIVLDQELLLQNLSLKLIRTIGSPFVPGEEIPAADKESLELYCLAVNNKIPVLYLEALHQQGKLGELEEKYSEWKAKYPVFIDEVEKVSKVLEDGGVSFAIYKTIKPYPALLNDIDLLIMGDNYMYRKAAEILLRAHYSVELPGIVEAESLTDDEAYKRAARLATKPTSRKGEHISPTSTNFVTPDHNILIDLRKELAMNYTLWMDKNNFREYIIRAKLCSGGEIKTLTPELDLACTVAHTFSEHLYLLGDYYTFLFQLSKMGEREVNEFANIVRDNEIAFAARVFITITAALYQAAHGVLPKELQVMCDKFGSDNNELKNIIRNNFHTPHRYKIITIVKTLLEKTKDRKFRRSVLKQILSMISPAQAKLVIGELIKKRKKEAY